MAEEPLQPVPDPEEEEGGPVKTFLEHLEDLRWVLVRCISALVLGMVACLAASNYVVKILTIPLEKSGLAIQLVPLSPLGPFTISMKIALYGGITVALPFILYFIADFVLPALKKNEKKYFVRAFAVGGLLFIAGLLLCYFVMLPISFRGLSAFASWMEFKNDLWRAEDYFHFVIMFMIGMGISFEIPVILLTLVRIGIISHEALVKGRMYFLIGNLVLCAFITPDAVTTVFMVLPVQLLFEACVLISKHWERQKKIAEATAAATSNQLGTGA